jgi:predicted nucleic acid-binding protein
MEKPTASVLDASIAVKWLAPEPDSPDALKIRDAHVNEEVSLFAPDLLTYEVANALRYRSSLTNNDLKAGIESLFQLDLTLIGPT